jgi:hypothetical protein
MSVLEEKWKEAIGSLILFISMGIGLALVPDEYVFLRFYIILLSCFAIAILWGLWDEWRDGEDINWRHDIPFLIVQVALMPLGFVGCFAMIGGALFLGLGLLVWDRDISRYGTLLLLGGAAPLVAMRAVSSVEKRLRVKRLRDVFQKRFWIR